MRVSIDATGLGGVKTGTAVYVTEILRGWNANPALAHEFVVLVSPKSQTYLETLGLDQRFRFVVAPDSRAIRILWQQLVLPWVLWRAGVNVHWGTGFVLPLMAGIPSVVTIHDLSFQLFPAVHEPIKRFYFPAMIAAAVRKARRVLAVSASTEGDLHRLLPASRGKTVVTLLAPRVLAGGEGARLEVPDAMGSQYVICLGTLEPRKNLAGLLAAWHGLSEVQRQGVRLLIVGERGWMMEQLLSKYEEASESVAFTGFVSDEALRQLLSGALALAYPSLYEGFGLPVVEAMSAGVPVLTSAVGATLEIAGDAALLVDPDDIGQIRDGLARLISDEALRARLATLGRQRAADFSWRRTAEQTWAALELAVNG